MKLPILPVLGLVAILGTGLWFLTRPDSQTTTLNPGLTLTPESVEPERDTELLGGAGEEEESNEDTGRVEIEAAVAPIVLDGEDPWASQLGGAIGRVVEEDGTPVADISVALVQADANLLLSGDWTRLGEQPAKLILEQAVTDEEGRFRLKGAYDFSFQGLGIDLRGPRSTVRVIDTQLHHGEVTDLGDFVLRKGCTIVGRVVDEAGAPAPGVRVRMVPAPPEGVEMGVQLGLQDFRADCSVGISKVIAEGGITPVIELPPLVRQHLDDLPLPTATTDAEGAFRFEGAPIGDILVGIDRVGFLGETRLETTKPGEVELSDFVLRVGRTITGMVMDVEGEPVQGAEVVAGCEVFLGEVAFLHPAGLSAADGTFELRGMPTSGNMMAAARRAPDEPWVAVLGATAAELEIELEEAFDFTVRVVDAGGEPVREARVSLSPAVEEGNEMRVLNRFMTLGAPPERSPRFREVEEGVYVAKDVTPGMYHVEARSGRLAPVVETKDIWSGEAEMQLTCESGVTLDVTVVDAATGQPIGNARSSVVRQEDFVMLRALAVGRTSNEGRVSLGPYDPTPPETENSWFSSKAQVLVQHPAYADQTVELAEGATNLQVGLVRGGSVQGKIRWGTDLPQKVYMLILSQRGGGNDLGQAFAPPRLGRSSLDGTFRFSNVPPGEYRLEVFERWFQEDPIELLMAQQEPTLVHREADFQVEPSYTVELDIDLSPDGGGQTARLAGSIRLDGRPVNAASIRVNSTGWSRTTSDENGYFETDPILVGKEVRVRIEADIEQEDGSTTEVDLYNDSFPIQPGEVRRLDIDVSSQEVQVAVVDPSGAPVPGAEVRVSRTNGGGRTDTEANAEGRAELPIVGQGKYRVSAEADGFASASEDIDVNPGEAIDLVTLTLQAAIPCEGICDFTALDYASIDRAAVLIQGEGKSDWIQVKGSDIQDDGRASFSADGFGPGDYTVRFWTGQRMSDTIEFKLPEGGDTNLVLVHP